ncbi:ADP-ribosylglycohydrolase family protein [Argonema antarcticum]|uniref:ADP-ribosylglycohydrolase family protein n=1 Tax=Argonema antarcticum TaxID=2942763 RepID=UPI002012B948|nr:ADP-ribosylglycohydrolase family protein [Argonema antarcticum A004/B2]
MSRQFIKVYPNKVDSIIGSILGTAVGDALGLPCEGLSKQRQYRLYGNLNNHHFLFGKGMVSDDTEHTCMVAQSLIVSAGNIQIFEKELAWRLRWWLLGLPAGIGYATLRAILRLWLGFPTNRAGVFSAGNGPAMRSAIIGVCYGHDIPKLCELIRVSTRLTHTDPKAEWGALAVAIASHLSSQLSPVYPQYYYQTLQSILPSEATEFLTLIKNACDSADAQQTTEYFANKMKFSQGISGYVYHTVPVVIHAWLTHQQDYQNAILDVIHCGGDTDTTAAILGGIIGANVGKNGIPEVWMDGLQSWPRTVKWMESLGRKLAEVSEQNFAQNSLPIPIYGVFVRNFFFLTVVILHGFRRLLPPY